MPESVRRRGLRGGYHDWPLADQFVHTPHKQPPVDSPRCRESFVSILHELSKDDRNRCQFCLKDDVQTHAVEPAPAPIS